MTPPSLPSSPSKRAAPLPPDERRASIVAAVLPLLLQHGELPTSRELAAAAGVSEGTIFKAFGDKDELLRAAMQRAVDPAQMNEAIGRIDRELDLEGQLMAVTEIIQQRIVDIWHLVSKLGAHRHDGPKPLREAPALTALLADHAEQLRVAPAEAAALLRALTLALSHPMLVAERRPAAEIVDMFLHGARKTS